MASFEHGSDSDEDVGSNAEDIRLIRAYPLSRLGGNQEMICAMHARRPEWDYEMVAEVFSCGGVPPLHEILSMRHNGRFTEVFFAIMQPNGTIVTDVKEPRAFMLRTYPKATVNLSKQQERVRDKGAFTSPLPLKTR